MTQRRAEPDRRRLAPETACAGVGSALKVRAGDMTG
ncbi:hypothetical protein QF030_001634 [Streptomyces rishiriensis]|uniref:Uncharacterized protein n=1 Tax=Streptomyces rishiriensis TaxID=68264 RepID=A0ABU0NK00_STRRH|nr:hypothetical protein [Streptomyces rishiriensis]